MRAVSWLLIALAVLQVLDLVTTLVGLRLGAAEANPVARGLLGLGTGAFVALKIALAGLVVAFIPMMEEERRPLRAATSVSAVAVAGFAVVVALNVVAAVLA